MRKREKHRMTSRILVYVNGGDIYWGAKCERETSRWRRKVENCGLFRTSRISHACEISKWRYKWLHIKVWTLPAKFGINVVVIIILMVFKAMERKRGQRTKTQRPEASSGLDSPTFKGQVEEEEFAKETEKQQPEGEVKKRVMSCRWRVESVLRLEREC